MHREGGGEHVNEYDGPLDSNLTIFCYHRYRSIIWNSRTYHKESFRTLSLVVVVGPPRESMFRRYTPKNGKLSIVTTTYVENDIEMPTLTCPPPNPQYRYVTTCYQHTCTK
jgi:hypothetical protein